MKVLGVLGLALLLSSCGDSNSGSGPRTAAQACDEICGWPDECFASLGVPVQADCVQSCEASVEVVGRDCMSAILTTIDCLGTCDVQSITNEQALACQEQAQAISAACE